MTPATSIIDRLPRAKAWGSVANKRVLLSAWIKLGLISGLSGLTVAVFGQLAGGDRGVSPLDSSTSYEVSGVTVDEKGDTADEARMNGWRAAQRKGWQMLWQKMHGSAGPALNDGALDAMVESIVVEDEQISEHRYIARLGVLFDRVRSGEVLGVTGSIVRSPPLLVIPVMWSGGTAQVFETRTEWQKAWARFRTGNSAISYVRPSGSGVDSLLLTAAQADNRNRGWWRLLLDQYGAADVIIPQVRLEHLWPGGPVIGHFTARYGPENRILGGFDLRVDASTNIPKLLDIGVQRLDTLYVGALNSGQLRPDPSLVVEAPITPDMLNNMVASETTLSNDVLGSGDATNSATEAAAKVEHFTVQFETPDAATVPMAEAGVRHVPGVKTLTTSSIAVGGTSVMIVEFAGDLGTLRLGLEARGFKVEEGGGALRITMPPTATKAATTP